MESVLHLNEHAYRHFDGNYRMCCRDGESPSTSSLDFSDEEALDSMEELEVLAQLRDESLYDGAPQSKELSRKTIRQAEKRLCTDVCRYNCFEDLSFEFVE